jgi:anti-sigma factor RsiW
VKRDLRRVSTADMLAYVDNCLPRIDRAALEDRMSEAPEIKAQVDFWLLQNKAIRAAFPDRPPRLASTAGGVFARRSFAPELARQSLRTLREAKEIGRPPSALARTGDPFPKHDAPPLASTPRAEPKRSARGRRIVRICAGAVALAAAGAVVFAANPAAERARGAVAAYRTFADSGTHPVEFATGDREALTHWFAPQLPHAGPVPELAPSGPALIGGRIVPGAFSPTEFVLYETPRHERFALEIEPIDSPPETDVEIRESGGVLCASWMGMGRSFALVGRASPAQMRELARLVRDSLLWKQPFAR